MWWRPSIPNAVIVALPDALLGQRFAGSAREAAATAAGLEVAWRQCPDRRSVPPARHRRVNFGISLTWLLRMCGGLVVAAE